MTPAAGPQFADLLSRALTEPGIVSRAYSAFHGYSLGNQILALVQCAERGIPPGPIATFMGWKDKGRYVRKGEKAITLCQPVTVKRKSTADQALPPDATEPAADQHPETFTRVGLVDVEGFQGDPQDRGNFFLECDDRLRPCELALESTVLDFEWLHARVDRLGRRSARACAPGDELALLALAPPVHQVGAV
jgi:hypothetical protein